jgi:hypothetical protein
MVLEITKFMVSKHPIAFKNQSILKKSWYFSNALKILYIQTSLIAKQGMCSSYSWRK